MKLLKLSILLICLGANLINTHEHSHAHKDGKCGHKHNLIPEIGIGAEMPKRITEDPKKRKLRSRSHPFKVHVDTSNVRGVSANVKKYLEEVIAVQGNKIFAEKIGVTGYQTVPGDSRIPRYCTYQHIVQVPDRYATQDTDADFVLLLATDDTGNDGTLAYATACFMERGTNRPNVGLAVFNPYYLKPENGKLDNDVATYVHEVLHALVFSSQLWKKFPLTRAGKKQYVISKDKHYLRGDNLLSTVRDHFGCQGIPAVPLEDDGGEGSKGGHFERIVFGDETMVSEDVAVAKFSKITLALMKDSGWYDIDLSKGDHYTWGKGEGCGIFNTTCAANSVEETCSKNNNFGCDKTYNFKMTCTRTAFTGQCNIKTKGNSCASGSDRLQYFESKGISSRCQEYYYNGQKKAGCVKTRCNRNGTKYQVTLNPYYSSDEPIKYVCSRENEVKSQIQMGKKHHFICENPKLICGNLCPKGCYGRGKCLENGNCSCDPMFKGEICGTFKGCGNLGNELCRQIVYSNKLDYKNYTNSYSQYDFNPDYNSLTSWADLQRNLVSTDSGI